jgi:hypothetical protein
VEWTRSMGICAENIRNGGVERSIRHATSVVRKRPFTRATLFSVSSVIRVRVQHAQKVTSPSARTARPRYVRSVFMNTSAMNLPA